MVVGGYPKEISERLLFRRQFVMGPRFIEGLPSWRRLKIGGRTFLQTHPDLELTRVEGGGIELTLLGFMLDPDNPGHLNKDILEGLIFRMEAIDGVFGLVDRLGGRWILILDNGKDTILFSDPAGLRQVFYTDPELVHGQRWFASQPGIIAEELGLGFDEEARKEFIDSSCFRKSKDYWWPGGGSPYREIKHLSPNHFLDVQRGVSTRFWPMEQVGSISLDDGIERGSDLLTRLLESANRRFSLALPLTAGLDSRILLSVVRSMKDTIYYYTLVYRPLTRRSQDVVIPSRILDLLGLLHNIIECPDSMDDGFGGIYRRNVTCAHEAWGAIALGMRNSYPEERVCVKGNCAETTRCYFHGHREPRKINAETLAYVTHMTGNRYAIGQFGLWLEDARAAEEFGYNPLDIFHWEQRMGNWQAMSQLEWDIAQEVFTPFNCRELLATFLAVDPEFRRPPHYTMHERIIERLWGEVLREPINPTSFVQSIRRRLKVKRTVQRGLYYLGR